MTCTLTLTLAPEFTCDLCGDACGHLFQHGGIGLCLGCELEEENKKERLIAEYEAREAAEGWGASPSLTPAAPTCGDCFGTEELVTLSCGRVICQDCRTQLETLIGPCAVAA